MRLAVIDETDCVGCAKCIPACPVDAIIGAAKFLHTVLTDECIGCGLCVAPCPMDCITMVDHPKVEEPVLKAVLAQKAKDRYIARKKRLILNEQPKLATRLAPQERANRQQEIRDSIARTRDKRNLHER